MNGAPKLPSELQELINEKLWPVDHAAAQEQHSRPIILPEAVRKFAPDEETVFLYPPPFLTVSEARKHNSYWNDPRSAVEEIDPDLTLILGDFGMGADTVFILDYRTAPPILRRLQWGEEENHWVSCGLTVDQFADIIKNTGTIPKLRG